MLIGLAISLALSAVPAEPANSAPQPKPKPKLICREGGEVQTSSHIRTPGRCMTAEEWQMEDAKKDQLPATFRVNSDDGVAHPSRPQ